MVGDGVPWHAGSSPEHSTSRSLAGADGRNRPPALAITTADVDSCRRPGSRPQSAAGSCAENRPVSSRKWHETGLDSKRTVHVIANPIDGILGIQTEIANPANPSARSTGSVNAVRQLVGGHGLAVAQSRTSSHSSHSGGSGELARGKGYKLCGVIPWVDYENLPDLPKLNMLNMGRSHPVRLKLGDIALNGYLDLFWSVVGLVHVVLSLPEFVDAAFGCTLVTTPGTPFPKGVPLSESSAKACEVTLPLWHHFLFLSVFWCELILKSLAFGFTGGKFAYWTNDFYNKSDIVATATYIPEIIVVLFWGQSNFSFRGLRLLRLLKPLGQLGLFSDLETVWHAFGDSMKPMATVMALIGFVTILFCIIGMSFWGRAAFRRRCVWADTLAVKLPEQFCHRGDSVVYDSCRGYGPLNPEFFRGPQQGENPPCERINDPSTYLAGADRPELTLDNSCGPFQLCLDKANPNFGFTSFDNLPASMITLVQVISGDNDVVVLWASIGAAPHFHATTALFYLLLGFLVLHVLINVLVAVFANVFTSSRELMQDKIERRRLGKTGAPSAEGSEQGNSDGRSQTREGNGVEKEICEGSDRDSKKSQQSTTRSAANPFGHSEEGKNGRQDVIGKIDQGGVENEKQVIVQALLKRQRKSEEERRVMMIEEFSLDFAREPTEEELEEKKREWEEEESAAEEAAHSAYLEAHHMRIDLDAELEAERAIEHERQQKLDELLAQAAFNKPVDWVLATLKRNVDPSLQHCCNWMFRNWIYETLVFLVTVLTACSLCLEGSLCVPVTGQVDCYIDPLLNNIVQYSNIFFTFDGTVQVMCDGSLSQHFQSGENIFNFFTNLVTTLAVILPWLGVPVMMVTFLRSFAIVKLLRSCKFGPLMPIWLMLVKACESLVPVMNLVIFNVFFSVIYYIFGRYLFGDKLNDNVRYNFSSISRGYMTLITVMTGDGWSDIMYKAMSIFCTGGSLTDECDSLFTGLASSFFVVYWFYGQFIFITMFLTIILEAFAVEEFMEQQLREDDDKLLTRDSSGLRWEDAGRNRPAHGRELKNSVLQGMLQDKKELTHQRSAQRSALELGPDEWRKVEITDLRNDDFIDLGDAYFKPAADGAISLIAQFQRLPPSHVSPKLMLEAWQYLCPPGKDTVSRNRLMTLVRMVQPMTKWRLAKNLGLVRARELLRQTVCMPLYVLSPAGTFLTPYPGDSDYVEEEVEVVQKTLEEAELTVAIDMKEQLGDFMNTLSKTGMLGEVIMTATRLGILNKLDLQDLPRTDPLVALKLLYDSSLSKRLGIEGVFERRVREAQFFAPKPKAKNAAQARQLADASLNLDALSAKVADIKPDDSFLEKCRKRFNAWCFFLVGNPIFDSVTFATIITSSVFLCLEPPHPSMSTLLSYDTLRLWDMVFNFIFCAEALSKMGAFGLYTPRSIESVAYLQVAQNRVDLFVLVLALIEMSGGDVVTKYIGAGTMKMVRLMKVMRPIRLLMRSEGLKTILEALFACRKPIFYATLFLFIVCCVFACMAMALFKRRFYSCNDMSFSGIRGEGEFDCLGTLSVRGKEFLMPRVWENPVTGAHFDAFPSAVLCLMRCLTLTWGIYWASAQDAYEEGLQPVAGYSMVQASLFFHFFLLIGSFFGLNLFASFMCDTFYSLQGTEQLEEVQWLGIKQMLAHHQPRIHRQPPKNLISSSLRGLVFSSSWQTFSAACLLVNVGFMASTSAEQGDSVANLIDVQNDFFFGMLCFEAFLNLIAQGPVLYVLTPSNQFDLFLITATTITIVVGPSLRSMSQAVRILRLSKFLRALSKHPTISAVFETVAVSLGQVINILIVLMVIILIFGALAVQLFGLVKAGSRIGFDANFATFPASLHTSFQLMFGEDMHALTDDCSISYPNCTPNIEDPVTGDILVPGDCGSAMMAVPFFFLYLIFTQYVMLNLFVGMIMNNFAFITTKDGNGVLQEDDFADLAFTWVELFDPKLTTLLPLEHVLPFFHTIGEPMGHYGTSGNTGRFLCVREELRRKIEEEEADESELQSSWLSRVVLHGLKDKLEELEILNEMRWKRAQEELAAVEKELMQVAGDMGDYDALERMGLKDRKKQEDEEQGMAVGLEQSSQSAGEGKVPEGRELPVVTEDAREEKTESLDQEGNAVTEQVPDFGSEADENDGVDREADKGSGCEDPWAHAQGIGRGKGVKVAGMKFGGGTSDGARVFREAPRLPRAVVASTDFEHDGAGTSDEAASVTVSGSQMGMGGGRGGGRGGAANKHHMKSNKVKKKTSNYSGIEKALARERRKNEDIMKEMYKVKELEQKLTEKRELVMAMPQPTPTLWMRCVQFAIWMVAANLSDEERIVRKKGHVRYNEVILALIYWNKQRNVVPSKVQELRRDFDEEIITSVAFQIVQGLVNGAVLRRRRRIAKAEAHSRFQRAKEMLTGKTKESMKLLRMTTLNARQKHIAQAQDAYARQQVEEYSNLADDEQDPRGPLLSLVMKMLQYELASGSEIAAEAQRNNYSMGKVGVFTLDEEEFQEVFIASGTMRQWARHVDLIEHLSWFIKNGGEGAASLVRLAAQLHKAHLGSHFQLMNKVPFDQLLALTEDPHIKAVEKNLQERGIFAPVRGISTKTPQTPGGGLAKGLFFQNSEAVDKDNDNDLDAHNRKRAEVIEDYGKIITADRGKLAQMTAQGDVMRTIISESEHRMVSLERELPRLQRRLLRERQGEVPGSDCATDSENEMGDDIAFFASPHSGRSDVVRRSPALAEGGGVDDGSELMTSDLSGDDLYFEDVDSSPWKAASYNWIGDDGDDWLPPVEVPGSVIENGSQNSDPLRTSQHESHPPQHHSHSQTQHEKTKVGSSGVSAPGGLLQRMKRDMTAYHQARHSTGLHDQNLANHGAHAHHRKDHHHHTEISHKTHHRHHSPAQELHSHSPAPLNANDNHLHADNGVEIGVGASRPTTALPRAKAGKKGEHVVGLERPATASAAVQKRQVAHEEEAERIEQRLAFARREKDRLERQLRVLKNAQEPSASGFERAESAEKRLAAKGRLEEKETRKAESETLGGVLTSPRDKAMAQRSAGLPPSRAGRRSKRSSQQKS